MNNVLFLGTSMRGVLLCGTRILIVLVMMVQSIGFGFAQATVGSNNSCGTCYQAPTQLDLYFRTIEKLIRLLNTGTPPDPTPGTGLAGEVEEVVFAALMAKDMALTTSVLATTLVTQSTEDVFAEFKLLAGSEARKRDRDALLKYDHQIMMATLSLTKSDRIGRRVPEDVLQKVDTALQEMEFVRLAKNQDAYNMYVAGARYEDLAALLRQLNGFIKQLHINRRYHNTLDDIEADYLRTYNPDQKKAVAEPKMALMATLYEKVLILDRTMFSVLTDGRTGPLTNRLEFVDGHKKLLATIREIQDAYVCSTTVKNMCNAWTKAASDGRGLVKDRWNTDGGRAEDTIKTARSRLMGTLFKDKEADTAAAKQRKNALLQSIYGQDIPEKQKRRSFAEVDAEIEPVPTSISSVRKYISRSRKKEGDVVGMGKVDLFGGASQLSTKEMAPFQDNKKKYPTQDDKETLVALFDDYLKEKEKTVRTTEVADLRGMQTTYALDMKIASLQNSFDSVLMAQYELATEMGVFTDVNRVTKRFPQLSAAVYKNIALIGDKNEPGVYNSMIQVCSAQCENLDPICQHDAE